MCFTLVSILAGLAVVNAFPVAMPNRDGPAATVTASWVTNEPTATITASLVGDEPTATITASLVGDEPTATITASWVGDEPTTTVIASEVEATGYYTGYTGFPGYTGYTATVEAVARETAPVNYRFTPGGNIVLEQE
ncbi:hypothetical protein P171DRAFT_434437 [Karstenula rhodostoma CBS 690.94]|uniref:Uncharacterized protein n=1 Tax=Karstenula rhodostoma CBS 690.94 TaxID=1392251 RepID=A0A9P4PD57_9PLEO|nr:hypothetical protein P171DRAFT_434437 [Karstenula rhodostoma CBS 690.94]